jgi:hypothetical protein
LAELIKDKRVKLREEANESQACLDRDNQKKAKRRENRTNNKPIIIIG